MVAQGMSDLLTGSALTEKGVKMRMIEKFKVGDLIEVAFGQRTMKVRVAAVSEVVRKEEAAALYTVEP